MKLQLLTESYSQSLKRLPGDTQRVALMEDPWGHVTEVTAGLSGLKVAWEPIFVKGKLADLCFENLGLSGPERAMLAGAIRSTGVAVPGADYQLRITASNHILVESKDPRVMTLPDHWRQAAFVLDRDDEYTWIGKRVRPEQLPTGLHNYLRLDGAGGAYRELSDGWQRVA